jgi:DNA-binding beta-propeller fold protein YncE
VDSLSGIITTIAGNGNAASSGDGALANNSQVHFPVGLAIDSAGNIFISDLGNRVRKIDAATGIISTIAGNGTSGYSGDGGPATSAQLWNPMAGVGFDRISSHCGWQQQQDKES